VGDLLVILDGTVGGAPLVRAVRSRLAAARFDAVRVLATTGPEGRRLAQARADLARALLQRADVAAEADAGPPDAPAAERAARAEGDVTDVLVVTEPADLPLGVALADRTAASPTLRARLAEEGPERAWVLVVPAAPPEGAARARLGNALDALREDGLLVAGALGPADPFEAALDALRGLGPDLLVVSTDAPARSRWLRADLLARLRAEASVPVVHVVGRS
jgi:hypothetical protein